VNATEISVLIFPTQSRKVDIMENDLSGRIRSRLERLGKSAASASVEAGLGRSAITDILSGNSGSPRLATLEKLTGVLQCSLAYLVGASIDPDHTFETTEETPRDHHQAGPAHWMNITEEAKTGVFEDRETRRNRIASTERYYSLFRSMDYPEWPVFGVFIADRSLSALGIQDGDIATVAGPGRFGKDNRSIPLQHGSIVYCGVELPAVGLSENSLRIVQRDGARIHLLGHPNGVSLNESGEDTRNPTRRLTINITDIPDSEDRNCYDAGGYAIRVRGIVVRILRDIHPFQLVK
jgi:transcriptional regulator with XRE-family HTH domain